MGRENVEDDIDSLTEHLHSGRKIIPKSSKPDLRILLLENRK